MTTKALVRAKDNPALAGAKRIVKVPMWARAREYSDEVLLFWAGMMRNKDAPEAARLRASENIIDRAYGKAPMVVLGDDSAGPKINLAIMGAEDAARLEHSLMELLGESLTADPTRHASLANPSPALELAASDADKQET